MLPIIIERLSAENYKEEVLSGVYSVSSFFKAAASLLLTILIFTAFMMTAFSFIFSEVEVRFYQPVVESNIEKKVNTIASYFDEYISNEKEMFSNYLANSSISSYLEARPTEVEQQMRTKATGDLFSLSNGLLGIRLIDANNRYIHFSTYSKDLISKTSEIREYANYSDIKDELPIDKISVKAVDSSVIDYKNSFSIFYDTPSFSDDKRNFSYDNGRIIFSVPFYDEMSLYRGFFVFYVDAGDFIRFLMTKKEISIDENAVLISSDDEYSPKVGFLFGLPYSASEGLKELRQTLQNAVLDKWNVNTSAFQPLNADSSDNWILFSA
ncbi:MAG: hypothetical protein K6F69_10615, partial [Treponema sp.]|nr:hypothetical protein [Treponema sp.]